MKYLLKKEGMCKATEKQVRSNTKTATTKDTKGMQKFCGDSKLPQYVLSRATETAQTYI